MTFETKPCSGGFIRALSWCHNIRRRPSSFDLDEEYSLNDSGDVQEMVIITIRARELEEKLKREGGVVMNQSIISPVAGELFIASKGVQQKQQLESKEDEEKEAFFSAASSLSRCSSVSRDAFFSARSQLSRSSNVGGNGELWDFKRLPIFEEFCECEGWPFGLYRKAILLPPLPKSPAESWSWHKGGKLMKMA